MSFGNTSAVHDHLSTRHPLFPRHMAPDAKLETKLDTKDKHFLEPLHDEGRLAERAPPQQVEDPKVFHSRD